jgi:hypothetical protein
MCAQKKEKIKNPYVKKDVKKFMFCISSTYYNYDALLCEDEGYCTFKYTHASTIALYTKWLDLSPVGEYAPLEHRPQLDAPAKTSWFRGE